MGELRSRMIRDMTVRGFAARTHKSYLAAVVRLAKHYRRSPDQITDDEIQTYVPAFPRKQWPVTLRQLMGHVAGVRHYRSEEDYMLSTHCERASEGLTFFANDPLRFEKRMLDDWLRKTFPAP